LLLRGPRQEDGPGPVAARAVSFAESPALRDVACVADADRSERRGRRGRGGGEPGDPQPDHPWQLAGSPARAGVLSEKPDAAVQTVAPTPACGPRGQLRRHQQPGQLQRQRLPGLPPDTNGDVGPNHYVQLVNDLLRVFGKDGTPLTAPFRISQLYVPLGGICATHDNGDGSSSTIPWPIGGSSASSPSPP